MRYSPSCNDSDEEIAVWTGRWNKHKTSKRGVNRSGVILEQLAATPGKKKQRLIAYLRAHPDELRPYRETPGDFATVTRGRCNDDSL